MKNRKTNPLDRLACEVDAAIREAALGKLTAQGETALRRAWLVVRELSKVKIHRNVYDGEMCWPTTSYALDAFAASREIAEGARDWSWCSVASEPTARGGSPVKRLLAAAEEAEAAE